MRKPNSNGYQTKKSISDKTEELKFPQLRKLHCNKTRELKLSQNSNNDKTQNSNSDKTKKNVNGDKIQNLKVGQKSKF